MAAQACPALGDGFGEAFAFRQAVGAGFDTGDFAGGVNDASQQVGWQQSAFGADGLKLCGAAGDGLSGNPKSEVRNPKGGVSGVSRLSPL